MGKRGKCQRQRYREKLTLSYRVRMLIKSASSVRPCRRGDHRNSRLRGVFSPLRTDSRQLVSKICWCVKTFGEMMNVPKWLEPIGFFPLHPHVREDLGGCGSADHPKLPARPRGLCARSPVWFRLRRLRALCEPARSLEPGQILTRSEPDRTGRGSARYILRPGTSSKERNGRVFRASSVGRWTSIDGRACGKTSEEPAYDLADTSKNLL